MRDGVPTLLSTQQQVVMLRPVSSTVRRGGRPAFVVAVYNRSKRPAELRVANITAVQTGLAERTPIHVYSYDELVAEAHRKQAWAAVGVALGGSGGGYQRSECRLHQHLRKLLG
jgi:hypothetical protein